MTDEGILRKHNLAKILEGSILLFIALLSRLKGKRGREIKKYVFYNCSWWKRFSLGTLISYKDAFKELIKVRTNEDDRLTETDARLAVVASSYLWEMSELVLDEKPPGGLYVVLWAFRSMLPWNRTGFNEITMNTVTDEHINEALKFLDKHLGEDWEHGIVE